MNAGLESILPHVPAAMMVLFRIGGIFIFGPVFGSNVVPMRVKALLALVLTICVYPIVPPQVPMQLSLATLGIAVGSELLIGAIIGYGASLPLIGLQVAGMVMGQQIGLMAAQVFNPEFDDQTEVLGQFMFLTALMAFLILGGHREVLAALVHSFQSIPLGGYAPDHTVVEFIVGLLDAMFELGIRVSAPLLCLVFLETVAMGFVARTVPQLNILSLGFPIRIIVGFFLLVGLSALMFESVSELIIRMIHTLPELLGYG